MKKSSWCFLIVMLITTVSLQGQRYTEDETDYKYEFGSNITQIINRFVVSTPVDNPDASFTLKIRKSEDRFIRFGADLDLSITTSGDLDLISNQALFRVGIEKRTDIEPWLDFYWGADVLASYSLISSSNRVDVSDITLTNTSYLGGARGFVGCHIKVGRRVALEFENNFQLSYQYNNEKLTSGLNPNQNFSESDSNARFQMILPRSIYLIIKLGS